MPLTDPEVTRPLRIAAVPAGHPYVQNLFEPTPQRAADRVELLPDPRPAGAPEGQWWPPVMLDAGWIAANADTFDVLHLHFGTESFSLAHLQAVVDALRASGRPLVFTVHDLSNPQLTDQSVYEQQLDLLIPAADELVTLTPGAAAEIARRWGREATVVGHPRVAAWEDGSGTTVPEAGPAPEGRPAPDAVLLPNEAPPSHSTVQDARPDRPVFTVGVHVRDLRPNIDALGTIGTLVDAVRIVQSVGVELAVVVELNEHVRDERVRDGLRMLVEGIPFIELHEHPRFDDAELLAALGATDVQVMPYAHGTHSGWLELCWDAGVAVAAPDVGFFAEQHPVRGEVATFRRGSADSLARALLDVIAPLLDADSRARRRAGLRRERLAERLNERRGIHLAHLAVYRLALAGSAADRLGTHGLALSAERVAG